MFVGIEVLFVLINLFDVDSVDCVIKVVLEFCVVVCVNCLLVCVLMYWWNGVIEYVVEILLLIKIMYVVYLVLELVLCKVYLYEVFEIIVVLVVVGLLVYFVWVVNEMCQFFN